ncbi:MAG: hypothetical protein SVS85_02300 [Candidatus Nanohaloarchaea archaeon]|nr:hypothetical protein [Candidatus Nanohaloarchaea archaeon]
MDDRLVVKEGFGIEDSGFLAFIFFQEVSTDDIPYSQITHVNVEESMEQQFGFIGTGNLEIYRPGAMRRGKGEESDVEQGEERIMLRGAKDPHKWERLIMEGDPEVLEEYEES